MRFDFSVGIYEYDLWRRIEYNTWVSNGTNSSGDNKLIWPPPAVCDHPAALLQVIDNMAFCDGCGRTFELQKFGGAT